MPGAGKEYPRCPEPLPAPGGGSRALPGRWETTTATGNSCLAIAEPLKPVLFRDQQCQSAQTRLAILKSFSDSASVQDPFARVVSWESIGDDLECCEVSAITRVLLARGCEIQGGTFTLVYLGG